MTNVTLNFTPSYDDYMYCKGAVGTTLYPNSIALKILWQLGSFELLN